MSTTPAARGRTGFGLAVSLAAALLVASTGGHAQVMAINGMVVSSAPMATQAGLRILQQGGNAFDAAVAVAATLAVV